MGRFLNRALERTGLTALAERALSGVGLDEQALARMQDADVLVIAGLADAVRGRHRGDEVRIMTAETARRDGMVVRLNLALASGSGQGDGPTGEELLRQVALARLARPADQSIGVSFDQIGLGLAQVALAFGADVLIGDLRAQRTLPLLDGPAARRVEITGLVERTGRRVRFVDQEPATEGQPVVQPVVMESRS